MLFEKYLTIFKGSILLTLLSVAQNALAEDRTYRDLTVDFVDLDQFMGAWFVQGHTPLVVDDTATNQVETYAFNEDGSIDTIFQFVRFGREWSLNPQATVFDTETNAHWKMQFLWPFKSDYLIVRLNDSYTETVISVPDKQLIWVMTREASLREDRYNEIISDLEQDGYPIERIKRVLHF